MILIALKFVQTARHTQRNYRFDVSVSNSKNRRKLNFNASAAPIRYIFHAVLALKISFAKKTDASADAVSELNEFVFLFLKSIYHKEKHSSTRRWSGWPDFP
jgi:hypothetical protein